MYIFFSNNYFKYIFFFIVIVSSPPGCTTNDDCPSNEACLNRQCRNPCNCGTNAQCFVQNHHPVCSCLEGYDGNPNFACRIGMYIIELTIIY